jgi:hypothetical protein
MTLSDALRLVAVLGDYYRQGLTEKTAALWARELVPFEIEDGLEAVTILGTAGRVMPTLRDLIDTVRECRNDRRRRERTALPGEGDGISLHDWLEANSDMHDRFSAIGPKWRAVVEKIGEVS